MKKYFVLALVILTGITACYAMGGKTPAKEQPKYKLEILKMEVIPTVTAEVKVPNKPVKK